MDNEFLAIRDLLSKCLSSNTYNNQGNEGFLMRNKIDAIGLDIHKKIYEVVRSFEKTDPSTVLKELEAFTDDMKAKLEDFFLCLGLSNKYIPKYRVEKYVTQLCFMEKMKKFSQDILAKRNRLLNKPLPENDLDILNLCAGTVGHLQSFKIPDEWLKKFQANSPRLTGESIHILEAETILSPQIYVSSMNSWLQKFPRFIMENNIQKASIWVLTEMAPVIIPRADRKEGHMFIGCFTGSRISGLDRLGKGSNMMDMKVPIITEWISAEGSRFNPGYFLRDIYDSSEKEDAVLQELKGENIYFRRTDYEVAIQTLIDFGQHIKGPSNDYKRKTAIVVSSYIQNPYMFLEYCKQFNIVPFFLPESSSHFANPIESDLYTDLQRQFNNTLFSLIPDNATAAWGRITLLRFLKTYSIASQKVFRKLPVKTAMQDVLLGGTLESLGLTPHTCYEYMTMSDCLIPIYFQTAFWNQAEISENKAEYLNSTRVRDMVRDQYSRFSSENLVVWKEDQILEPSQKLRSSTMAKEHRRIQEKANSIQQDISVLKKQSSMPVVLPSCHISHQLFKNMLSETLEIKVLQERYLKEQLESIERLDRTEN